MISTPGSAREARTTFELGNGDALITYELEGLLMKEANAPIEIVVPTVDDLQRASGGRDR